MLISLQHSFVFFCTPKCASNSVEAMLKPHSQIHLLGSAAVRHTNVRTYQALLEPYLQQVAPEQRFERVAIIREPLSWLFSWYRFRARSALRTSQSENSTAHVSFAEFVDAFLSDEPPQFARLSSQYEFLCDHRDEPGVNKLFAYDRLDQLREFFSDRVGKPLELRAINVSPTKVYGSNLRERLAALKRGVFSRLKLDSRPQQPAQNPRELLNDGQIERIESRLDDEIRLYRRVLNDPALG